MEREQRRVVYDSDLGLEACRFRGLTRSFPDHFHEYYVIGLVEVGERRLSCRNQGYDLGPGQLFLFDPGDSHGCVQSDGGALDYRSFNIAEEVMLDLAEELTGCRELPGFFPKVVSDEEAACCLRSLYEQVMAGSREFGKEEGLLLLLGHLLQKYARPFSENVPPSRAEVERACVFMEENFARRITLDQLCHHVGLSRSALLRAFAGAKGVTPYRYLENIRIGRAKRLLEQGAAPVEATLQTGFSDQSHFTNCFTRFIGLPPGAYRETFMRREKEKNGSAE